MLGFPKDFLQKVKESLTLEKGRLQKQLLKLEEYPEQGASEDDNVLEFEQFEEQISLDQKLRKLLGEIEWALGKIENGKYGICERHKGSIEKERLEVYPAARYCTKCAKILQKNK